MPTTSPDRIVLTDTQRGDLDRLVRAGRTEQRLALRAGIVLAAADGHSNARIAASLGVCEDTARKWRHRWCAAPGVSSLGDAKRSGRPAGVHPGAGRPGQGGGLHARRRTAGYRCRGGRARNWPGRPSAAGSASRSRRPRCAAGWPRTPSNPGSTSRGSSSPTPTSSPRPQRVLDLYQRVWDGKPLGPNEYVISADEKTSIQARCRCHPTLPPGKARMMRVNHDYHRRGAVAYLAAYDVHRAKVYGRCEDTTGIVPFTSTGRAGHDPGALRSPRTGCSGSWTTAPRTAGRQRSTGSPSSSPTRSWCTPRCTRPG